MYVLCLIHPSLLRAAAPAIVGFHRRGRKRQLRVEQGFEVVGVHPIVLLSVVPASALPAPASSPLSGGLDRCGHGGCASPVDPGSCFHRDALSGAEVPGQKKKQGWGGGCACLRGENRASTGNTKKNREKRVSCPNNRPRSKDPANLAETCFGWGSI